MKKKLALMLMLTMVIGLLGCNSGAVENSGSDYSYHWKVASAESGNYYMVTLAQEFIDRVNQRTDGKVTGEVFHSGQLGGLSDVIEGLEMGNIDVVLDGVGVLGVVSNMFDTWGLPYLYDSKEHQYKFWDDHFDAVSEMAVNECDIRMVTIIDGLNRQLSCKKPINNLADLKGMKIRVPSLPTYLETWTLFGAAPIPMSFSEVYTSIQTGVVQGQENDIPLTLSMNFYEVAPYCILTSHQTYEGTLLFSEQTFQSYPKELQEIILEVGQEIKLESRAMIEEIEKEAMSELDRRGVTVISPDLAEFKDAVKSMYGEYSHCKPVLDLLDAARS